MRFHSNYIFPDINFAETRLEKRLARDDRGINLLDACCDHDNRSSVATISLNDTQLTIYSPRRRGNALLREL